jgi:hypothetical protein
MFSFLTNIGVCFITSVIRELDCLKRRSSLFRKKTEASLVLEWIEECMVRTPWWIHVQSSMEEGRHIAPTPPASPQSRFSQGSEGFPCGTGSSVPFPAHGSFLEIVSPTAEDHILEYALSYRKMNRDGQLILLTNDVTLKIKAMSEVRCYQLSPCLRILTLENENVFVFVSGVDL